MTEDETLFLAALCHAAGGRSDVPAATIGELAHLAGLTADAATLAAWHLQRDLLVDIDRRRLVRLTGPGAVWCRQPRTS